MARAASTCQRRHRRATMPIRTSDAYEGDGGACIRRYHDQEHVNEASRTRPPVRVVPAAVCAAPRRRPVGSGKEGMADEAPL